MARPKKDKSLMLDETQPEVVMSEVDEMEKISEDLSAARMELERTKAEIEAKKKEIANMPLRELDPGEQKIVDKQITMGNEAEAAKQRIAQQKAYDDVLVTGRFMNRRAPGQPAKLTYMKYNTDPVKWYKFEDGKTYTIPRGFVDQINDYYHTPVFVETQQPMDPNRPMSSIGEVDRTNKKYAFVAVGFAA
jgi:hypothetical protein